MAEKNGVHPLVVFWLGVLTGAIVVGLVFFYRVLVPADYETSTLRYVPSVRVPSTTFEEPVLLDTSTLDLSTVQWGGGGGY